MSCINEKTARIRELNDALRQTLTGGRIMMTAGISALGPLFIATAVAKLRSFSEFDESNDPYGEHDFGAFNCEGQKLFWKIDYYDPSLQCGSEDAGDPKKTTRVLTLMLASEY